MKKNVLFLISFFTLTFSALAQGEFITVWDLSKPGSGPNQIEFGTNQNGDVSYTWETIPAGQSGSGTLFFSNGYVQTISGLPSNATIRLHISPINFRAIAVGSFGVQDQQRLILIESWGGVSWNSMHRAFRGCSNLNVVATNTPSLNVVSDVGEMFFGCTSLNGPANINSWNMSYVQIFDRMFFGATSFNLPIGSWNTSSATNMHSMFANAQSFNQYIGNWILNPAVDLTNMLNDTALDCDNYSNTLIGWAQNNPAVTNRNLGASGLVHKPIAINAKNQLLSQGWTISDAGLNGPCNPFISTWKLSNTGSGPNQITFNATVATGGANFTWETIPAGSSGSGTLAAGTSLRTISGIPTGATIRLNIEPQNLQRFFFNNVGDRQRIIDVENWGGVPWTSMEGAFYGCSNLNISATDIPILTGVSNMANMFRSCFALTGPVNIGQWNVSNVSDMQGMFRSASNFNQDVSSWNVSNVLNMFAMFRTAAAFNQNLGPWVMSNAVNLSAMLEGAGLDCENYSATLLGWAANNPTALNRTLDAQGLNYGVPGAAARNTLINNQGWTINDAGFNACGGEFVTVWNLAIAGSGPNQIRFFTTHATGGDQYYWETIPTGVSGSGTFQAGQNLRIISGIPSDATIRLYISSENLQRFNISNWNDRLRLIDVEQWGNASWSNLWNAFYGCNNLDISATDVPNVSNVTNFEGAFRDCHSLTGPTNINSWDISNGVTFERMFQNALSFNQALDNWTFSNVTNNIAAMFAGATSFNQPLDSWNVDSITNFSYMFQNAISFNQNIGNWKFRNNVNLLFIFENFGMDCENLSNTFIGWAVNNSSVLNKNMGTTNGKIGSYAVPARNQLLTQGWSISGLTVQGQFPFLVATGQTENTANLCTPFVRPSSNTLKLLSLNENGNTVNYDNMSATVTNAFVPSIPVDVTTHTSGNSGYYNLDNGATNVLRISRRMFTIQSSDTYPVNGGVLVRVYFDPNDMNIMLNDPASLSLNDFGWFKSSSHNPQDIINEMSLNEPMLASAVIIEDVTYGTEAGVNYAEFLVESFSTFGMYAKHKFGPLPVSLTALNTNCQGETLEINWTTASEFNASHYTIQSSRDGFTWQDLGEVNAAGTTNQSTNYSFETKNYGGLTYFRLVQVDLDGATEIFGPISANCALVNNQMTVFPNPTADNFTVRIETTQSFENATLELVDMTGRVIMSKTIDIHTGSTLLNFNGAELKTGTYFVRMKGENERFAPVRVVRM